MLAYFCAHSINSLKGAWQPGFCLKNSVLFRTHLGQQQHYLHFDEPLSRTCTSPDAKGYYNAGTVYVHGEVLRSRIDPAFRAKLFGLLKVAILVASDHVLAKNNCLQIGNRKQLDNTLTNFNWLYSLLHSGSTRRVPCPLRVCVPSRKRWAAVCRTPGCRPLCRSHWLVHPAECLCRDTRETRWECAAWMRALRSRSWARRARCWLARGRIERELIALTVRKRKRGLQRVRERLWEL